MSFEEDYWKVWHQRRTWLREQGWIKVVNRDMKKYVSCFRYSTKTYTGPKIRVGLARHAQTVDVFRVTKNKKTGLRSLVMVHTYPSWEQFINSHNPETPDNFVRLTVLSKSSRRKD